ncbi:hypothetical protein QRD43_20415 [Pelomonas sp. APW6]|uniref:Uncharacterized protein n=1 Tax=Roseateles subflavus TaxID=3053353 RepID=A0ABT7LN38_9BURK|nr:hypothetical protein [Pelomonas sp. APW6]MDL5034277.1 hypothetical protein [Pelomonas sp. APW6]
MLTTNQVVLARLLAANAISKASRTPVEPPQRQVMEALREAIAGKQRELEALVLAGQLDSEAYRETKRQVERWNQAWTSNR